MKALVRVSKNPRSGELLLICSCRNKYTVHIYNFIGEFDRQKRTEIEGILQTNHYLYFEIYCTLCFKKTKIGQNVDEFDDFLDCLLPYANRTLDPAEIARE